MPEAAFVNLPAAIQAAQVNGYLEQEFRRGLQPQLAYSLAAFPEPFGANLGQELKMTRAGLKAPVEEETDAGTYDNDLDNGMSSQTGAIEQFSLKLKNYNGMEKIDNANNEVVLRGNALRSAYTTGKQAAQSRERLARNTMFRCHMGGHTRVVAGGTTDTTHAHIDCTNGFDKVVIANNEIVPPTNANKLLVHHYAADGTWIQDINVNGVAIDADVDNVCALKNIFKKFGKSGTLTFDAATAPVVGDILIADNAATMFRPNAKLATSALTAGDGYSLDVVQDVVAYLRDNGVEPFEDGFYYVFHDATSELALLRDPAIQMAFAGNATSAELRKGFLFEFGGVRFVRTTESPVERKQGTGAADTKVLVRRAIVVGEGCLMEADWAGLDNYLDNLRGNSNYSVIKENNMAMIIRQPLDALGRFSTISWYYPGAMDCGTDVSNHPDAIATGNPKALYKRAGVIEFAG